MANDRVSDLLAAYFNQPYVEYGDVVLDIRTNGGLTAEEARLIENRVLCVDAHTIIRQAGISKNIAGSEDRGRWSPLL